MKCFLWGSNKRGARALDSMPTVETALVVAVFNSANICRGTTVTGGAGLVHRTYWVPSFMSPYGRGWRESRQDNT